MNQQILDVTAISKKLKEKARAHPWIPVGVPPREHYHKFRNELMICFTLDVLPETRYWHLSIARIGEGPTREEMKLWCRAFFDEEPNIVLPGGIAGLSAKHFYWRVE